MRRLAGAGLLLTALIGLLVIAGLQGVRVAGTAMAPPGLSAPSVGDCLTQLRDPSITGTTAGRPSTQLVVGVTEDVVTFAGCGAAGQLGEVVGYQQYPQQSSVRGVDIAWCQTVSDDYQAHEGYRFKDASGGLWAPSTGQRFLTVLSRLNADEQEPRWAACVVLAPNVESYMGSFLQSLAEAPAPAPFGLCLAGIAVQQWVSCDVRHDTQEFGIGTGQLMTARMAVDTCQALISRMTGLPDITAGGLLRVEVVSGSDGAPELSPGDGSAAAHGTDAESAVPASCRLSVVGNEQLVGTLIGVGVGNLPIQ